MATGTGMRCTKFFPCVIPGFTPCGTCFLRCWAVFSPFIFTYFPLIDCAGGISHLSCSLQMPPKTRKRARKAPSISASPESPEPSLDDALVDRVADKLLSRLRGSSTAPDSQTSRPFFTASDHAMAGTSSSTGDQVLSALLTGTSPPGESPNGFAPPGGFVPISAPLGVHVALQIKEKIWRNEFVDIASLLPPSLLADQQADAAVTRTSAAKRTLPSPISHADYITALLTLASIRAERMPQDAVGLLKHIETVRPTVPFSTCL